MKGNNNKEVTLSQKVIFKQYCSASPPQPIELQKPYEIVQNSEKKIVLPATWKNFFKYELPNCDLSAKFSIEVD
jgi:hypothetical protein